MDIANQQGDALTVEQIEALVKERDEAKTLAEKFKNDKDTVVSELTEIRKKKQELESALAEKQTVTPPVDEVDQRIAAILARERASAAEAERQEAIEDFLNTRREFSPDVDTTGLLRSEVEKKLARFNTSGVSKRELVSMLEDAAALVLKKDGSSKGDAPYASMPASGGAVPPQGSVSDLQPKERELIAKVGWTSDKYLKMKAARPDYIEQLLSY